MRIISCIVAVLFGMIAGAVIGVLAIVKKARKDISARLPRTDKIEGEENRVLVEEIVRARKKGFRRSVRGSVFVKTFGVGKKRKADIGYYAMVKEIAAVFNPSSRSPVFELNEKEIRPRRYDAVDGYRAGTERSLRFHGESLFADLFRRRSRKRCEKQMGGNNVESRRLPSPRDQRSQSLLLGEKNSDDGNDLSFIPRGRGSVDRDRREAVRSVIRRAGERRGGKRDRLKSFCPETCKKIEKGCNKKHPFFV